MNRRLTISFLTFCSLELGVAISFGIADPARIYPFERKDFFDLGSAIFFGVCYLVAIWLPVPIFLFCLRKWRQEKVVRIPGLIVIVFYSLLAYFFVACFIWISGLESSGLARTLGVAISVICGSFKYILDRQASPGASSEDGGVFV